MACIEARGLRKAFGTTVALDGIDLHVGEGRIVGLIGPNGAGKTTTMRILTCFLPPTEGKVTVADYDVFEQAFEAKKHIGYLPEAPPVYPEMTVEGYLTFVARLKNVPAKPLLDQGEDLFTPELGKTSGKVAEKVVEVTRTLLVRRRGG